VSLFQGLLVGLLWALYVVDASNKYKSWKGTSILVF
jgi:hypothetical protein